MSNNLPGLGDWRVIVALACYRQMAAINLERSDGPRPMERSALVCWSLCALLKEVLLIVFPA
jgi:hypothetical protein